MAQRFPPCIDPVQAVARTDTGSDPRLIPVFQLGYDLRVRHMLAGHPGQVQIVLTNRPIRGCRIGKPRRLQSYQTTGIAHAAGQFHIGCSGEGHAGHVLGHAHVGATVGPVHVQHVHSPVAPQQRGQFDALGRGQPAFVLFAEVGPE